MNATDSIGLRSPAAFRSAFADADEFIVLVIHDIGEEFASLAAIEAVDSLRKDGRKVRLLIIGPQSEREKELQDGRPWIGVVGGDGGAVLPALLATVDAVILDGMRAAALCVSGFGSQRPRLLLQRVGNSLISRIESVFEPWIGDPRSLLTVLSQAIPPSKEWASSPPSIYTGTSAGTDFVLRNDWGIGDELLLSAVAREIVRSQSGIRVWIRSRHGFRYPSFVGHEPIPEDAKEIEILYQNPSIYGPAAHSPFPGHLVQQMLDKFAHETGIRVKAKDLRPELDLPPVVQRQSRTVVLHTKPNSRLSSKDWGLSRWEQLARLLSEQGIQIRQVGRPDEPLLAGAEDLRGTPVSELGEVLLGCSAVVCLVGFLMHLAEATRTPAVVIYGGREHPAIDGYQDQIHLSSEPMTCRGRWGCHLGPDLECSHGMKCMEGITPELVAKQVLSLVTPQRER